MLDVGRESGPDPSGDVLHQRRVVEDQPIPDLARRRSDVGPPEVGDRFGDIGKGFVTASLVYCIGAMAIVGSLQEGLTGDASIIYAKALIDGTVSVIFTASMGIGVMLAAVPVLFYQGAITLAAGSLQTLITDPMLAEVSGVGGVLIIAISLNMLKLTKIKLANLLPGLPLAVLLVWLGWF